VIRGPSGTGKSTLLMTIGGMLQVTSGNVFINGINIYQLSKKSRAAFRAENIGFVFQMFHLIPYLDVGENVLLASRNVKKKLVNRLDVQKLLARFNLANRENHKPAELSAGELQRTAVARAFFSQPKIILADEPTGNLDPENAQQVFSYLYEFHSKGGTVIVVTHGHAADQFADRIILLKDGQIREA